MKIRTQKIIPSFLAAFLFSYASASDITIDMYDSLDMEEIYWNKISSLEKIKADVYKSKLEAKMAEKELNDIGGNSSISSRNGDNGSSDRELKTSNSYEDSISDFFVRTNISKIESNKDSDLSPHQEAMIHQNYNNYPLGNYNRDIYEQGLVGDNYFNGDGSLGDERKDEGVTKDSKDEDVTKDSKDEGVTKDSKDEGVTKDSNEEGDAVISKNTPREAEFLKVKNNKAYGKFKLVTEEKSTIVINSKVYDDGIARNELVEKTIKNSDDQIYLTINGIPSKYKIERVSKWNMVLTSDDGDKVIKVGK